MPEQLTNTDHNRNVAGLKYIYPVISRRAGGLSIGVNFNSNNACNWRCIYCQVPDLKKGSAPEINFSLLEKELTSFLNEVLYGDFYQRFNIPTAQQMIKDIAISGNGEPTTLKNFAEAIQLIAHIATKSGVFPQANFVLISNGSLMQRQEVQQGLKILNQYKGEVWFKLDSATPQGLSLINNTALLPQTQLANLITTMNLCNTKLQTCLVNYRNQGLLDVEKQAYLSLLKNLQIQARLKNIMLYSVARTSFQPEAVDLKEMPLEIIENFANEIRAMGFQVSVC